MTPFDIYLIFQADTIQVSFVLFAVASLLFVIGCIICWIHHVDLNHDKQAETSRNTLFNRAIPLTIFFIFISCFMPTTKTLVAMYSIPKVIQLAESPQVQALGSNSVKALNKLLSDYMEKDKK